PPSAMEIPMPAPICLIENSPWLVEGGVGGSQDSWVPSLCFCPSSAYLSPGFSLGSTIQSHTKGIWMWCLPHPSRAGHTLVLLDTEGLGDVEKGDAKNDTWIFALAVLLSSTLVYNSLGTINQQAMEQLQYSCPGAGGAHLPGEGTRCSIQTLLPQRNRDPQRRDSAEFVRFFPAFVWAVRDFVLQLVLDGREITEDEYLENALKLKRGRGAVLEDQCYNLPRKCIRQFFPARKCFVFVPPAGWQHLPRLEKLRKDELEPEFQEQVAQFCRHVWETSKPKTIPGGHVVTGAMLGNLAVTYVDAIRSGAVPCMESAVLALAQMENLAAVGEAVAVYEEQLGRRAALPTESVQELLDLHAQCEREALRAFMARAFKDDDRRFQEELMVWPLAPAPGQELCRRNEVASSERCKAALLELSQELDDRIGEGVYSVPGGYQHFLDDRQRMVDRYRQVPGKGVKADAALQEFLQSKAAVAQSILQTDKALMEKEKEMAGITGGTSRRWGGGEGTWAAALVGRVTMALPMLTHLSLPVPAERARAEAAKREQQVLKQKEAELQQKREDQDRSYQENLRQLETKLEDERKKLLEEDSPKD
uniref:GB1/RHD3-type G domain-containing protein n=1 Tax=Chrysemys picta bellii TaxID=8478 RepID=A0A8C3HBX2_CHRPI